MTCPKCPADSNARSTKGYCTDHMAEAKAAYSQRIADSKAEAAARREAYAAAHAAAVAAGRAAAEAAVPVPMIVSGYEHQPVMDGVCGFAWVKVPGNTGFGRWAKGEGIFDKSYSGGLMMWISDYGQSMTRKEAYAMAYADSLRASGIENVYAGSRMD
jgi:hypothetical protein